MLTNLGVNKTIAPLHNAPRPIQYAITHISPLSRRSFTTSPTPSRSSTTPSLSPSVIIKASSVVGAATTTATTSSPSLYNSFASIANAATNFFPVFVVGAAVLGLVNPSTFDWYLPSFIAPALGITMLGMGLTLTFDDFRRVLSAPRRIFAGFSLQYTVMPLMAYLVSRMANLPLDFVIGLCIVGSCPGGTASNVVTYLANADVPLSVAMTTASTLGAVVATPLLTQALLGTLIPVDALALLVSTLQVVLLPVVLGAAINSAFPRQVEKLAPISALTAVVLIAVICGATIAQNSAAVLQAGPRLLAAVGVLHLGGFTLGYFMSKALKFPETAARTNSIEVGMQNSALGAVLATAHFPAHPLAAVPCAISACMHSVIGSLLAAYWRTQPTDVQPSSIPAEGAVVELDASTRRQQVKKWIAEWRIRTNAPGKPSDLVTVEEMVVFSEEQLAFLERKRSGRS